MYCTSHYLRQGFALMSKLGRNTSIRGCIIDAPSFEVDLSSVYLNVSLGILQL